MNWLSFSRFHFEFTISFTNLPRIQFPAKSLWIYYLLRLKLLINANLLSAVHYEYNICIEFHYEFTNFFANLLSALRFLFEFTIYFTSSPWIQYLFLRNHYKCAMKSLLNHYEITMNSISFAISIRIHHFFANSLSVSRNNVEFTILLILSLWIHYLLRHLSLLSLSYSRIHYLFRELTLNPLSFLRNHYETTIESQWIFYLLGNFTKNPSSFSRNCFANFLCIHYLLWIHFLFSRIHYLFREFTLNSLFSA